MVYTQERLNYALQVFRDSAPHRRSRVSRSLNIERKINECTLRTPPLKNVVGRPRAWKDKDDSGDYSPSSGKKKQRTSLVSTSKKRQLQDTSFDSDLKAPTKKKKKGKQKDHTYRAGRMNGLSTQSVLHLRSPKGKELLRTLAEKYGTGMKANEVDLDAVHENQSLLRARLTPPLRMKKPRFGPMDLIDDLTPNFMPSASHCQESVRSDSWLNSSVIGMSLRNRTVPATGCTACAKVSRRCSLRSTKVGQCSYCRGEELECSLAEASGGEDALGSDNDRTHMPSDRPSNYGDFGKSLSRRVRPLNLLSAGSSKDNPINLDDDEDDNDKTKSAPPSQNRTVWPPATGNTRFIETNWAHPITFDFGESTAAREKKQQNCHFCDDYRYGIFGCGKTLVEVFQLPIGGGAYRPYHEIDGHVSRGKEPTRMCVTCVQKRLAVRRCVEECSGAQVEWKRLVGAESVDAVKWIRELFNVSPGRDMRTAWPCCALCPSPAAWRCDREGHGCGLVLCAECKKAVMVGGLGDQEKDRLVQGIVARRNGKMRVRADLEFLVGESELSRACRAEAAAGD